MALSPPHRLIVFTLEDRRYALRLEAVECAIRAVEITALSDAPGSVRGVINFRGVIVPVLDLRQRLGFPARELELHDHFVIGHTAARTVALLVDCVLGVEEISNADFVAADTILPGLEYVAGVVRLPGGMIFVHDIDTFLSLEETAALERALAAKPEAVR